MQNRQFIQMIGLSAGILVLCGMRAFAADESAGAKQTQHLVGHQRRQQLPLDRLLREPGRKDPEHRRAGGRRHSLQIRLLQRRRLRRRSQHTDSGPLRLQHGHPQHAQSLPGTGQLPDVPVLPARGWLLLRQSIEDGLQLQDG